MKIKKKYILFTGLLVLIGLTIVIGYGGNYQTRLIVNRTLGLKQYLKEKPATNDVIKSDKDTSEEPMDEIASNTSDQGSQIVPYPDNISKDYYNSFGCNYLDCNDVGCQCASGGEGEISSSVEPKHFADEQLGLEPSDTDLTFIEKKILFQDEYSSGCPITGDKDYLIHKLRRSTDGKTIFTTGYMDATYFQLDDTYMNLESHDNFELPWHISYDCGASRSINGFVFGDSEYGVYPKSGYTDGGPVLFKKNGNSMDIVAEFRGGGTTLTPYPKGNTGYMIGDPDYTYSTNNNGNVTYNPEKGYLKIFVGKNGKRYGLLGSPSNSRAGSYGNPVYDPTNVEIYDVTDFEHPVYMKNVEADSVLAKLITADNRRICFMNYCASSMDGMMFDDDKNSTYSHYDDMASIGPTPYYIYSYKENGKLKIYDFTNPLYPELLANATVDSFYDFPIVRVDNTLYRITGTLGKGEITISQLEIGKDINFKKALDINNVVGGINNIHITENHMLFAWVSPVTSMNLEAYNLKTGKKVLSETSSTTYAKVGDYSRALKFLSTGTWTVVYHEDYYYFYGFELGGSTNMSGGPNVLEVIKIAPKGSATYTDDTCTPSCPDNGYCGQSDGCGGYCAHPNTSNGDTGDSRELYCTQPLHSCEFPQKIDSSFIWSNYKGAPSCTCELSNGSGDGCTPGATKCDYFVRPNGTYAITHYTCEGSDTSCSLWHQTGNDNTMNTPPAQCTEK